MGETHVFPVHAQAIESVPRCMDVRYAKAHLLEALA